MRTDEKEEDTDISRPNEYSRDLTASLIGLFYSQNILPVDVIFFNDPLVPGVTKETGHDNHFHVRFRAPKSER